MDDLIPLCHYAQGHQSLGLDVHLSGMMLHGSKYIRHEYIGHVCLHYWAFCHWVLEKHLYLEWVHMVAYIHLHVA